MTSKNTQHLADIAEAKAKLAEELRKLEEQEVALRGQQSVEAFEQITALLKDFAEHFSSKQKAEIAGFVVSGAKPKKATGGSRQEVAAKYWLPHTGETWTGRGRPPRAFAAWEGTAAYTEWKKNHPDDKFPKFPG
ncbi:H-NS family nucleoid-associated regulatory protein [Pseudoxanthomonas sp. GM95]|uniref:H-NS histone family protein n=1 Tax=Pseudoxanthomonas sp. GM95 TaxID=1881043 RepID=UPI000B8926E3|nr:H-NS family nucleoid-associated regulatory protein [Pseudoxanthomonas sp. GM95]